MHTLLSCVEVYDEQHLDTNCKSTKQSERYEDESWFEADYEPEGKSDTEEIERESDDYFFPGFIGRSRTILNILHLTKKRSGAMEEISEIEKHKM